MQIPRSILLALVSALAAYAQTEATGPNAFTNTQFSGISAGQPFTLTWNPTTQGTVSLILRSGASSDLNVVEPIAQNIENSGTYTWTPSEDAVRGSDYTIEIVSDDDESATNYSAYFVLDSDNTVAATTAVSTTAAPLPTTIPTASPTSGSASSSESDSSSSATETNESTTTGSASTSSTASSSRSASASDLQASASSSSSEAAGARATAMVGLLGAVALGAIAL